MELVERHLVQHRHGDQRTQYDPWRRDVPNLGDRARLFQLPPRRRPLPARRRQREIRVGEHGPSGSGRFNNQGGRRGDIVKRFVGNRSRVRTFNIQHSSPFLRLTGKSSQRPNATFTCRQYGATRFQPDTASWDSYGGLGRHRPRVTCVAPGGPRLSKFGSACLGWDPLRLLVSTSLLAAFVVLSAMIGPARATVINAIKTN